MARIFITGSADGLGQLAAKALISQGHEVVLHARNENRGRDALNKVAGAATVVTGDLGNMNDTIQLASKVNALGRFDAVIHNAGVYNTSAREIFAVNTLAPYMLTCLIEKPKRLIYLSSGMHEGGRLKLESLKADNPRVTYADSKLHVLILCKAVARRWPDVYANAVDPGWVPTKMGGRGAPGSLEEGYRTQVWLAVSNDLLGAGWLGGWVAGDKYDEQAKVSGCYFYHQKIRGSNPEADDVQLQERFMDLCKEITGVSFPNDY